MPYYNKDAHEGPVMDHISFIFILMLFSYLITILPCDFFSRSFVLKLGHIYLSFSCLPQAQPILLFSCNLPGNKLLFLGSLLPNFLYYFVPALHPF